MVTRSKSGRAAMRSAGSLIARMADLLVHDAVASCDIAAVFMNLTFDRDLADDLLGHLGFRGFVSILFRAGLVEYQQEQIAQACFVYVPSRPAPPF